MYVTQHRQNTRKKAEQITREGGVKSNTFWNIRKQILNHNKNDNYDTYDEEGKPITDPHEIKEHVANYFEELYQAREGEDSHSNWTKHINETVKEIATSTNQSKHQQPFKIEELDSCIKTLKKEKKQRT